MDDYIRQLLSSGYDPDTVADFRLSIMERGVPERIAAGEIRTPGAYLRAAWAHHQIDAARRRQPPEPIDPDEIDLANDDDTAADGAAAVLRSTAINLLDPEDHLLAGAILDGYGPTHIASKWGMSKQHWSAEIIRIRAIWAEAPELEAYR